MPTQESQNQQLAEYIKKNLSKGYTSDALKFSLIQQGYSRTSVEKAMEIANKQLASKVPKMIEKPRISISFDENELKEKVAQDSQGNFFTRLWRKFVE